MSFGPLEFWKLQSLFLLTVALRKASVFGLPELWRLDDAFLFTIVLRRVSISDFQSSRAHFDSELHWEKRRFRTSRALDAYRSLSIMHSDMENIDLRSPELWKLQSSFWLRTVLRKASIPDRQSSRCSTVNFNKEFYSRTACSTAHFVLILDLQRSRGSTAQFH